ncbi:XRE family transcriptional regulator [Streptococcus agalactiae FSL S3-251]|uniref:Transcriptional regulator, Cro/CI family n=1 Tax=Streptococcus agalactiae TaxID=1311 RepID=A0A7Z7K9G4_STRAG|nr:helix-turn-helix transcriptional regulator [Streptococcus agalactiae]EPX15821.1 XRE family transcriptional regulator [Streptococcus agalactiae LDS 610]EPV91469.1 XRE family transcriptional regulator [Streptococcus agalactiae FSL S3-251]KLL32320.1 Cro/Cl family transcriptional regulator [Streptococcus agalactiae]PHU32225.1 XRE family transcriptional regulator [Streptococcus agalactiae]SQA17826.1 transcriptional regulator, Cro/CI family [Streptococcus agalactiae]
MEFSERLKTLRKQAHLTQKEIAEKLGISQPAYGDWERGVKMPTHENSKKLARLFNITLDTLMGNQEVDEEIDLSDVEMLFRTTSDGMTEEEKAVFRKELIEFMKERKKAFEKDKNSR